MTREDVVLGFEMGKLEIEPGKPNKERHPENPFIPMYPARSVFTRVVKKKCTCMSQKRFFNRGVSKKKYNNNILKEPVLKILQCCDNNDISKKCSLPTENNETLNSDTLNLCTLVQNCNQLKISSESNEPPTKSTHSDSSTKWWRNDIAKLKEKNQAKQSTQNNSCCQQALNPPCDVTIDELASYFETLVHIPKKMSSMAEMMYI
ncbi:uncharacterized protein LOC114249581 [Bombyx mandarina]|uniref:Oxidative stress-responsive serine-rich protein 1 n=2 Tax=Bombyx TaxID=7090 RepID=A0A8R2AHE2_BOMMO|nr:uncharacterized protein LOC101741301 [Bombyx mori]XP_004926749.1 uncharacterized protein LOC101741301 [Bombyx mori]XP_028039011.1 uncharacterized protein LOC114249581 [Bombyx mandarina]XP_028039012.1 uncharacterized protein LOC114249581 [Bombyx mandarina]